MIMKSRTIRGHPYKNRIVDMTPEKEYLLIESERKRKSKVTRGMMASFEELCAESEKGLEDYYNASTHFYSRLKNSLRV